MVERVRPAASTKPRLVGEKEQEEKNDEQQGISDSGHKSPATIPDAGSSSSDVSPKDTCPPEKQQKKRQETPKRPSLVPAALWDRLSQEFNVSQLRAIWAAAASAREAQEDLAAAARDNDGRATPEAAVLAERRAPVNHAAATANRREGGARGGGSKGGVVLLQGPPGTGKTRTVLGVVSAILARREEKDCGSGGGGGGAGARGMGTTLAPGARQKRPGVAGRWVAAKTHQRILVCAPSNGAVDELAQRLALESGGVWDQRGNAVAPRVVRLGKPSEDAADRVKAVSLEFMVEERVKLHAKSAEARTAETKIRETHARIDEAGRAVRSGGVGEVGGVAGIGSAENRRHQLNTHIRRLRGELLVAKQRRRDALRSLEVERGKIRRSLVVCATLSGCGSGPMVEAVSLSGKGFDTVIVDEACQATEPSTLIPLSLGCKRLILVGDPRQLPATVISQRAARLNLEVSLFERLERAGYPVHMLTVQYRMHPEIRAFPSARFYNGRLTDAPCVRDQAAIPAQSPSSETTALPPLGPCFPPFLLVDVSSGSERRAGSSYQNPREASFVSAFLARLVASGLRSGRGVKAGGGGGDGTAAGGGQDREKSGVVRVGVITPYRGQVHCIQQELSGGGGGGGGRRLKGGVEDGGVDAEVSTVDGFQGKEVDVVLFSCVRAPSSGGGGGGGIGFLADQRRMNVALTRARRSLVVLGNVGRLSSDGTWKALVDHSKSRDRLEPEAVKARTSGGGSGGGGDGEALCARLEETAAGKKGGRDRSGDRQSTGRNRAGRGGRGEADDAVGSGVAGGSDKKEIQAPRRPAGSRTGGHGRGDGSGGINVPDDRAAAAVVVPPAVADIGEHCADRRANPRHEPESVGSGQRRKPSSRGGDGVRPSAGLEGSVRDRPPVDKRQQRHEEAGGAKPTPRGSACRRPDGGAANRPQKRARADGQGAAKRVSTPDGGFLGGLLSSLSSNAGGIASGKEHDFRQGLRGGEDEERRRVAAAPRLGGARVTELSRPVEPKQAPPARHSSRAAAAATGRQTPVESDDRGGRGSHRGGGFTGVVPPSTPTDARNGGRAVGTSSASTVNARRVAPSTARRDASSARVGRNQFRGGANQHSQPPPQPSEQRKRARRVEPAAATGAGSGGASSKAGVVKQLPASRRPGASGGSSGGKSGGAKKTESEASRGGGGTSVLDILQGISDTWGDSSKKK
ncbi:Presumed helicase required for RNA polymerase II transcription termination and processing of RNAs [Ectocarpus siliculosus]|uniref:Presumed helicase required for RNA polymerase II transcription termination and processing of RNAs n=1 Tax=Ectocarpus siliculosus TaxID=2880 RepID=D8LLI3_ECTSI|nr:Presumed helicase required for RNA polymerase II transcription termination and processing of RNAs [Ectocarpus siliculosus]|eukprot:CBN79685.1 Presumed helicase required for RNA polymerase II transcription termination and processing of RNAs [Ectocarpus siliculosus]